MDIEQQLRVALAPCRPEPALRAAVLTRISAGARSARSTRRKSNRVILLGAVLVAAAAAAMFLARLFDSQPRASASWSPPPQQLTTTTQKPAAQTSDSVAGKPAQEANTLPLVADAPRPFTVLVQPLRVNTDDPDVRAAIQENYKRLVDELRTTPRLVLLAPAQSADAAAKSPDFRITFIGKDESREQRSWMDTIIVEVPRKNFQGINEPVMDDQMGRALGAVQARQSLADGYVMRWEEGFPGQLAPDCGQTKWVSGPLYAPCTPARSAVRQADMLRALVFPPDPEAERRMLQRLLDRNVPDLERSATIQLLAFQLQQQVLSRSSGVDQEILRGALSLIASTTDPAERVNQWRMLVGGLDQTAPVGLLIEAASREIDEKVRAEAVTAIARDFDDDPEVRTALQSFSEDDSSALVRNVARQLVSGGEMWREYVIATIKDTRLTPAQRFEPLDFMVSSAGIQAVTPLLNEDVVRALKDVLPALVTDPDHALQPSVLKLLRDLGDVETPSAVDLLLAVVQDIDDDAPSDAQSAALFALTRHRDDPRARKKLEEIADRDPDL